MLREIFLAAGYKVQTFKIPANQYAMTNLQNVMQKTLGSKVCNSDLAIFWYSGHGSCDSSDSLNLESNTT